MKLIPYNKILRDHFKINIFSFFYMQVHPITDHIPYSLTYILSSHPHKDQLHVTVTPGWSRIVKPFDLYIYINLYQQQESRNNFCMHTCLKRKGKNSIHSKHFPPPRKMFYQLSLGEKKEREREREEREEKSFVIL